MPKFMLIIHIIRARVRARVRAIENSSGEEAIGHIGSLMNSFSASANG
jgi:hypothetical protein